MTTPYLTLLRRTLHQFAVGTTATVAGTVIALFIWQQIETSEEQPNNSPEIVESNPPAIRPKR